VEYSYARIASVFLSPDEEKIAVYVEDSKGSDWVQERYIEIFALDDLEPGTLRRDVRPLQIIPDATVATFSPDSRYVATDKGLYSVEFSNQTPAINGTISAFSPDSQVLATYQDGFVTLWRVPQPNANNFPLAQYDVRGARELAFSEDGTRLYVIRAGEVQVWGIAP
jgi:WD40 repeat protein